MATIRDIAKLAGVSPATVSRVLNHDKLVAPATKEKVEAIITKESYLPNQVARSLFTKKSNIIGIIVPDLKNPFYTDLVTAAENVLNKAGYQVMISINAGYDNFVKYNQAIDNFLQNNIDGLITASFDTNINEQEVAFKKPLVIYDGANIDDSLMRIVLNNYQGGQLIGEHLLKIGTQKVVIQHHSLRIPTLKQRFLGLTEFLDKHNIAYQSQNLSTDLITFKEAPQRLFEDYRNFDTVVAFNDMMAAKDWSQARKLGIHVPEELRIIGYDNTEISKINGITTIDQKASQIGALAAQKLLALIEGQPTSQINTIIDVDLIQRFSTQKA